MESGAASVEDGVCGAAEEDALVDGAAAAAAVVCGADGLDGGVSPATTMHAK